MLVTFHVTLDNLKRFVDHPKEGIRAVAVDPAHMDALKGMVDDFSSIIVDTEKYNIRFDDIPGSRTAVITPKQNILEPWQY